jgi:hypothetical protein
VKAEYGHGLFAAPDEDEKMSFRWLHIRPGEAVTIVMGNKAPLWYKAHWYGGRMIPCEGEGCRLCDAGVGRQRRWVFAVSGWSTNKVFLWEVSEHTADQIRGLAERHDGLENLKLRVSREEGSKKGRLDVTSMGFDEFHASKGLQYPEPQEALELTWAVLNLACESLTESRSTVGESKEREV